MPRLYFLLFLTGILFSAHAGLAQQNSDQLRTQATELTRQLAGHISLDDARTIKVRRLIYDRLIKESEVQQLYSNDPAMRSNKLREIEHDYALELKTVVNETQFSRYLALNPSAAAAIQPPAVAVTPATQQVQKSRTSLVPPAKARTAPQAKLKVAPTKDLPSKPRVGSSIRKPAHQS
ncbi:hypothetical protein [Hymenobacter jejuensis]|uniref:DUF4296 domain-containing protein n=1 Tax=Hymenobacter jejuensis TaxID=2502781 RepID=A0A5B8A2L0_9BACT|nr:hypothetical protein [Hymenobacter jejuensis]QDA60875.1 hypothetical protein FHG12_12510 [Hymenobacter jejuensis]